MNGNTTIAVVVICVILGTLGLYYIIKTACMTLIDKTVEASRKEKAKIELAPPSAV